MKRAAVGLFGAVMVAAAIVRYPPDPSLRFEPGLVGWPDGGKLAAMLLSCTALLALDLAAYAAGRALHRRLRPEAPRSLLALLEQMALGFLVVACGALALAALHALYRPLLVGAIVVLGVIGAATAIRELRGLERPARIAPRTGLVITGGAAALLVSPFLAAWVPDYGWDAFTYHLALPERYLFRNRIVVTPLFPHSAFPQMVEMLYLVALSLDSGALAKLIHLQFGLFTALAVFAMARSVSMRAGLLAVAILAADPLFNWELSVAYNDLAATLFAVLATAAFDEWRRTNASASLRMAAIFAGACVSVRYPAGVVPAAMACLIWLGTPWRAWRPKLAASLTFAGVAALVLSPWLLRNLVFTGNPVAPAAQSVFHAPGHAYFSPVALEQSVGFTRSVGFGRGLDDLALLPVNITLRARVGDYAGFGFRIGVLYVVGMRRLPARARRPPLACCGYGAEARRARHPLVVRFVPGAAVPPARAVPRRDRGRCRPGRDPAAAPRRAGTAVAGPARRPRPHPVERGDAATVALRLRARRPCHRGVRGAGARARGGPRAAARDGPRGPAAAHPRTPRVLLPGMDYLPASPPEVVQMIHEAPSPDAFADRLRALGVTHVLVNANNVARYPTWYVQGYGTQEHERDLARLEAFLARHTTAVIEDRGVIVRRLNAGYGRGRHEAPARHSRFSNRVNSLMKARRTVPVGPLRCLPMMISAMPRFSSVALYSSSRKMNITMSASCSRPPEL